MKIGFLLPGVVAVDNLYNGVREQARLQAEALESLGHEVVRMDPWVPYDFATFDVLHFFQGGPTTFGIEHHLEPFRFTVFAPIIDSNQSNLAYRSAARVGQVHRKIFTIQGEYAKHGHASNLVVVRSRHEHDRVVQGLGISAAKVEIVLNGVSPPEPVDTEAIRQQFQLPDQFVLHISQITLARKNVAAMIEAIGPTGLPLIIAGSYGVKAEFDRLMQIANRYKNIRYIGPVKSPVRNALYAACRVFCLPSLHEGTGLVSLEAASYGARVVATRLGGPLDYLLDLVDYCSDPSPAAIRTAVLKAWERPDAEALRQHVTENLTWQNSAYQLLRAYDKHRVSK